MALARNQSIDQSKLQRLVYIAHGHCLALTGQPLTGDCPEAWKYGPVYVRLADALAEWGNAQIRSEILMDEPYPPPFRSSALNKAAKTRAILDEFEARLVERIYGAYAVLPNAQLATLTRGENTPWASVRELAPGRIVEIGHDLIGKQFARFSEDHFSGSAPNDFD